MPTYVTGQLTVNSFIGPAAFEDQYPTHKPIFGLGGIRTVGTTTEMEAIYAERREEGMIVYVSGVTAYYALIGTTGNSGWTTGFTFGRGGGGGIVGDYVQSFNGATGIVTGASLGGNTFTALNTFSQGITTAFVYASTGSTFGGTVRFVGGTTFDTLARFTNGITASSVYASTGSTFGGTLQVVGGTTLAQRVDIGGILDVVSGVTLESTLDVSGAARFDGNVTVGNAATDTIILNGNVQGITVSTNVATFNAGITTSGIYASTGSTFGGTLQVVGGTTLAGSLDVSGAARFDGNVVLGNAAADTITPTGTFQGITVSTNVGIFNAGITTSGIYASTGSTFGGTLQVVGGTTLAQRVDIGGILDVVSGVTFESTLDVGGAARFDGNVVLGNAAADTITPTGTFQGITVSTNVGIFNAGITTSGIYASTGSTFGGTLQVNGGSTFATLARFNAGITTSGIYASTGSTFGGTLQVVGGTTLDGTVDISGVARLNGNIVLGNAAADTITPTGTFQGITVSTNVGIFNAGITTSGIYASTGSTFGGTLQVNGGATFASTDHSGAARFDNTVTIKGSAANTTFDTVGNVTVGATLTVNGNFFVAGTVTTVNRTDLQVDDKTILLGRTLASDNLADGGGIILSSGLTASITWSNTYKAWTSNQGWDIAGNTYAYRIAGATALAATYLGSVITGSSLASVGTITSGRWRGSLLELAYGGASADLSGTALNGIVYKAANNLAVTVAGTNTQVLSADGSGVPTWANLTALTGITATSVNINSSGDSGTYWFAMMQSSSTGARVVYTDTGMTFDAGSNTLSCTKIEAIVDGGTW